MPALADNNVIVNLDSSTPTTTACCVGSYRSFITTNHKKKPLLRNSRASPSMGLNEDFDDRQIHREAEQDSYHPYEYQTDNNGSWAGALPVKQGLYDPSLEKDACGVGFAW